MHNLFRGIVVILLLAIASVPVFAQETSDEAVVRVIPNEAVIGSQHVILVTGLDGNEAVTVRIVSEETGGAVYEAEETADDRGIVEVEIFSETGDRAGDYVIEVVNADDDVIGTATFTILEAEVFTPEIAVSPLEGEFGTTFTVEIADTRPFQRLTVTIENEDNIDIFSRDLRSSVDGLAVVEFDSSDETVGTLTVQVRDDDGALLFEQDITVLGVQYPTTTFIEPNEILPGDSTLITLSGLEPDVETTIEISLDGTVVGTLTETANVSGLIITEFTFDADVELGNYTVSTFQNGELVGESTITIAILAPTVSITPPVGTTGTNFLVTVSDLRPNEEVIVEFIADGEIIQTRPATADATGEARALLGQRLDLELGDYDVRVIRMDTEVFTDTVEIAEERPSSSAGINADDVTVTIDPTTGLAPTLYNITVEGLPENTPLTIDVVYEGESVLSLSGTTNTAGTYITSITSEESDPVGAYSIEVTAGGMVVGSVDFEISDEASGTGDETGSDTEVEGNVLVTTDPTVLRQGERIEFFITELVPDETVIFELIFDDEVIYETQATANADGATSVALVARDDEPLGEYSVRVLRDGDLVASNDFEIVASDAVIDEASVRIEPESGIQGTDYAVIVTGLAPNEVVDVVVSFDGDAVFETTREANDNGEFTVVLGSDGSDELGTYDVVVVRDGGDNLSATLTISEADSEVAPAEQADEEAVISIDPEAGELGTEFDVSITGLVPNETFEFIIEFDGDIVYNVERTADDDGNYVTTLATSDSDPLGEYLVIVARDDAPTISTTLTVTGDEPADDDVSELENDFDVALSADEVDLEEAFEVYVSGLDIDETVTIIIEFDGEVVFETERAADELGEVSLILNTAAEDPTGTYTISVIRGDEVITTDVIVVAPDATMQLDDNAGDESSEIGDVAIVVEPALGEIGTNYEFIVSGLAPNQEFVIEVEYNGEVVFEANRTADVTGFFTITLETSDDDDPGIYTFNVLIDGERVASTDFTVEGPGQMTNSDEEDADGATSIEADDVEDAAEEEDDDNIEADDIQTPVENVTYADEIEITFNADDVVQVIEFEGQAGDVVSVTVDSNDSIDTIATLFSPSGELLTSDDDGGLGFDPEIERVALPEAGTYTLEIVPFTVGATGSATVTVTRDDVRTLDDDETRTVALNSKITTDILTFEGDAGDVISLVLTLENGDIGALSISAEQGDAVLMTYQTFGLPQTVVLGFVVPEDGTVVIEISDDGTGNALIGATIERE